MKQRSIPQQQKYINQMASHGKSEAFYGLTAALRPKATDNILDEHIQKGAIYLDATYSHLYGWLIDVSTTLTLDDCVVGMPNIFDTAVILEILTDAGVQVSMEIINHAKEWFLRSQHKSDQVWNFFIPGLSILPNDLDTTSNTISCLYELNAISKQEAVNLANHMVTMMCIHEDDGLPDVYIYKGTNKGPWKQWKVIKRVDLVVICNVLHCLAVLNMDDVLNSEIFKPSWELICREIRKLVKGQNSPYCKNYDNLDVVLFFISRVVAASKKARKLFGTELGQLVVDRFGKDKIALNIGCRILAAVNLEIITPSVIELITREAWELIGMQNEVDSSWPSYAYYNAHKGIYFGSKAVTTGFVIAALNKLHSKINLLTN